MRRLVQCNTDGFALWYGFILQYRDWLFKTKFRKKWLEQFTHERNKVQWTRRLRCNYPATFD